MGSCMYKQSLTSTEGKRLFIKNPKIVNMQSVSVDKRDTVRLYNKLHRNIVRSLIVALCKTS